MILVGRFEFRGVEKRNKKEGGCYVLAHCESIPFDGNLHNFLCSEDCISKLERLERGSIVDVSLSYNDRFNSFRAVDFTPVG